jgi:hypothetical protein
MAKLFLSYARKDTQVATKLVSALSALVTKFGGTLIEGGTCYSRLIDEALEAADAVLVLWSAGPLNQIGCATRPRRP